MKHIVKITTLFMAITTFWIGLLQASIVPRNYTWLLPLYLIVSLGCYGLLMVGIGDRSNAFPYLSRRSYSAAEGHH